MSTVKAVDVDLTEGTPWGEAREQLLHALDLDSALPFVRMCAAFASTGAPPAPSYTSPNTPLRHARSRSRVIPFLRHAHWGFATFIPVRVYCTRFTRVMRDKTWTEIYDDFVSIA